MIDIVSRNNKSKFLIKYFSDRMICELNYVAWAAKSVGLFNENYRKSQLRLVLASYVISEKITLFHYSENYEHYIVYSPDDVKALLYDSSWKYDFKTHDIMEARSLGWVLGPEYHDNKFNYSEYRYFEMFMDRSINHQNNIRPIYPRLKKAIEHGNTERTTIIYH